MRARSAVVLIAVLVLSGCAGHAPPSETGSPTAVAATPSATATPDDGLVMSEEYGGLANATDIDTAVQLSDGVSVPWAMNFSYEGAPTIFVAYVAGGACGTPRGLEVTETHETITITAVNDPPTDAAACLADPSIEGGSFDLEHALGTRQLLHGPLSDPWLDAENPLPRRQQQEPEPEPTVAPVLQDAVYVTSEGLGDIRIGQPIPRSSSLVSYDPELCNDQRRDFSGGWAPKAPFDGVTAGHPVFDPVTKSGRVGDPVTAIWIRSAEIPTKSGVRVGDSVDTLLATYPDIGDPIKDEMEVYVIEGDAGKVIFGVGYPDYRGEWEGGVRTVLTIVVLPIDADLPVWATDTNFSCKA